MDFEFWKNKPWHRFSKTEWEALCSRCGRCCLEKLENPETGDLFFTRLACRLLDLEACTCRDYRNRFEQVPDCLPVDLYNRENRALLPAECAYRTIYENRPLPYWHYLVCGRPEAVHEAGKSVRTLAVAWREDLSAEDYIIEDEEF